MNYIISEDELVDLLASYYKLQALENGGVDNWEWYGASISDWEAQYGNIEKVVFDDIVNCRKVDEN